MIRVATSINISESKTGSICPSGTASIVAPSDLELEFDDIIINSQTYGRLLDQAQAKPRIESLEELGDLIDFTDDDTVRRRNGLILDLRKLCTPSRGCHFMNLRKSRNRKNLTTNLLQKKLASLGLPKVCFPRPLSRRTWLLYSTMRGGL
jgi:hypothetical protein